MDDEAVSDASSSDTLVRSSNKVQLSPLQKQESKRRGTLPRPLQSQMREYFINSEALFRQAYHREMLSNLSPQLQRACATEELGAWVRNIPFLNDALASVGGLRVGVDVMLLRKDAGAHWTQDDLMPGRIVELTPFLTYTVRFYDPRAHGHHASRHTANVLSFKQHEMEQGGDFDIQVEHFVAHERVHLPLSSPLGARLEEGNREWKRIVSEFSLALRPKLFMMGEFIVRPGSTNTDLYLLMHGSAFRNKRTLNQRTLEDQQRQQQGGAASLSNFGGSNKKGFDEARYLSAKNFAVIGTDIINTLVGAPMICAYSVSAIGHASCNVLTSTALARIATNDLCPRILAELRHVAGWRVFKSGVLRLGRLAMQEREARLKYYTTAFAFQKVFWEKLGVEGKEKDRRVRRAQHEGRAPSLGLLYHRLPTRNRHVPRHCVVPPYRDFKGPWVPDDDIEAYWARTVLRPGRVVRAHAKTSRDTAKSYEVCFYAMDCKLQLGVDVKVPPDGRTRVNMRVSARPTPDASFEKARLISVSEKFDASEGRVKRWAAVRFPEVHKVVGAADIRSRHPKGSTVKVRIKHRGVFEKRPLRARVSSLCDDGAYAVMFENDQVAAVTQWLFWHKGKKFSWFELDHCIIAIISSYRKMLRIDMQIDDERTRDDEDLEDLDETQSKEGSLAFTRRLVKTVVGRAEDDLSRRITHLHDKVAGLDAKMDAVLAALGKSTSPVVPARDLEPDDAEAHASLAKIAKKSRGGKS